MTASVRALRKRKNYENELTPGMLCHCASHVSHMYSAPGWRHFIEVGPERDSVTIHKRDLCIILAIVEGPDPYRQMRKFAFVATSVGKTGWVYAMDLRPGVPRRPRKASSGAP